MQQSIDILLAAMFCYTLSPRLTAVVAQTSSTDLGSRGEIGGLPNSSTWWSRGERAWGEPRDHLFSIPIFDALAAQSMMRESGCASSASERTGLPHAHHCTGCGRCSIGTQSTRCEPPQVLVRTTDDMWERELSYEEKLRLARNLIERFRAAGIGCELGTVYGIH
jgi:hypothetical protein